MGCVSDAMVCVVDEEVYKSIYMCVFMCVCL